MRLSARVHAIIFVYLGVILGLSFLPLIGMASDSRGATKPATEQEKKTPVSDTDVLLDTFLKKGLITTEDVEKARAEIAKRAAEKLAEPPKGALAKVGVGNLTFDGLVQVWFVHDPTTAFGARSGAENTFRLRRGEIALNGDIGRDVGFHIMVDPAKLLKVNVEKSPAGDVTDVSVNPASTVLQDLDVRLRFSQMFPRIQSWAPNLEAVIGQQKTPITEEGYRSSAKLDLVERSQIGRNNYGYGDRRDVGILFKDNYKYVDYYLGMFNGAGLTTVDDNNEKTFAGHLVLKPLRQWKVGGFGQLGSTLLSERAQDRWGFDTQWEWDRYSVKAEYAHGRDIQVGSQGFYIQPGVFLIPGKLQLVTRYDRFDPNTHQGDDSIEEIAVGLNWFFHNHNAKFQFEYLRRDTGDRTNFKTFGSEGDVILMNIQAAF